MLRHNGASRGLAIYGLLLELYPRAYLQRHREELLQNFQDLEQSLASKAALWRLIAKDLAASLQSELVRSFLGQTTLAFAILSLVLAIAHRHPGKPQQALWHFCCGYVLGWFAGWFGWHWRMSPSSRAPGFLRSFRGQAAMLGCAIAIVLGTASLVGDLQPFVLTFCYGIALAWVTGWYKNKRRMSL